MKSNAITTYTVLFFVLFLNDCSQDAVNPNTLYSQMPSQSILSGTNLLAGVDYNGLAGYAIKAAIGGAIWMVFKLFGDYLSQRMFKKRKDKEKDFSSEEQED